MLFEDSYEVICPKCNELQLIPSLEGVSECRFCKCKFILIKVGDNLYSEEFKEDGDES